MLYLIIIAIVLVFIVIAYDYINRPNPIVDAWLETYLEGMHFTVGDGVDNPDSVLSKYILDRSNMRGADYRPRWYDVV